MKTKDGCEQAHNCPAGVEAGSQVIVCQEVTAKQNDHDELVPMVGVRDTTFSLHSA